MTSLEEWNKHEGNRQNWKLVMSQQLAKEALLVARMHMLPRTLQVASSDSDTILTVAALEQARQGGWHAALSFIEDVLTSGPAVPKEPLKLKTLNPEKP